MGILATLQAAWTGARTVRGIRSLRAADNPEQRQRAREHLAHILGKQRGMATKLGQWLATSGSDRNTDPLHALCDSLEPIDSITICHAIEASLKRDIDSCFSSFSDHGHAASLSQVHHATLHQRYASQYMHTDMPLEVAVKVQYPFIKEHLAGEMKLLGIMPSIGPVKKWGVDINGYRQVIADNIAAELDYCGECDRQESYRNALAADEHVVVPRVYRELSSDSVLCQEWLDGSTLQQASTWDAIQRNALASTLLRHFLTQTFIRGRIHADPHDGNYRFRPATASDQATVVLYDFGSLCSVNSDCASALIKLINGLDQHSDCDPLACLVMMGFDAEKLQHIRPQLPAVCKALFAPFLHHGRFALADWQPSADIQTCLGEHTWWFRSAGPANFLMLMRAFTGLHRQLTQLKAFIDWRRILDDVCSDIWDTSLSAPLPRIAGAAYPCSSIAQNLNIRVTEHNVEKVSMSMPALSVNSLQDMLDADLANRIASQGIDIPAIIDICRSNGYQKQELFTSTHQKKTIRVWLS